jgi:hypothetical protein
MHTPEETSTRFLKKFNKKFIEHNLKPMEEFVQILTTREFLTSLKEISSEMKHL